ncbi:MAG TPA: acetate/propionate family kinase [Spongiibacteraceae bacterium]|nr:acetate/propionate family kinase [Spongiibacteraceae bacterium]
MLHGALLIFNAGSSSLKFTLFEIGTEPIKRVGGAIERLTDAPELTVQTPDGKLLLQREWQADNHPGYGNLLKILIEWLAQNFDVPLLAAGHRIVHGGPRYRMPVVLSPQVLVNLRATVPLAPLHLPHNLEPIDALAELYPQLAQIACFDTGFHATTTKIERLFGLPRAMADAGIERYGFHGLSYEYIASRLPLVDAGAATGRTLVAHLGNGASVCAMVNGKSVATSMGFSALDGLVMGTRCGSLDPGVLIYLLRERNYDAATLEHLLYHESGLLGLSGGLSSDMRDLSNSDSALAREAIEVFVHRLVREIGALAATAGGFDALVFTGGIGEHAPLIRAATCAALHWLGVELDSTANAANALRLHSAHSRVGVWMIPTDEELVIARHCVQLLSERG